MSALRAVKLAHTAIWAFFVACIFSIPLLVASSRLRLAAIFAAVVAVEVVVLLWNGLRCPLTDVAGRYTTDRRANFDIYLPEWLARHNKVVFGALYVASVGYLLLRWLSPPQP